MTDPATKLTLLERREIEARIVGPLVRGFVEELGADRALSVVRRVVSNLAREAGAERARDLGDTSLQAFASVLEQWRAGGALEIQMLRQDEEHLDFNVTRCRFVEIYRALGLDDLGASLSCCRDFSLIEGFNPALKLVRTQTLMEGAPYCDFRFQRRDDDDVH